MPISFKPPISDERAIRDDWGFNGGVAVLDVLQHASEVEWLEEGFSACKIDFSQWGDVVQQDVYALEWLFERQAERGLSHVVGGRVEALLARLVAFPQEVVVYRGNVLQLKSFL